MKAKESSTEYTENKEKFADFHRSIRDKWLLAHDCRHSSLKTFKKRTIVQWYNPRPYDSRTRFQ